MLSSVLRKIWKVISKGTMEEDDLFLRLEELLPGIPHAVTLKHITTKMSWSTLQTVSSVGRSWRRATQSRLIYDTRVQSEAQEQFVVLIHRYSKKETDRIALYSFRERAFLYLPPIPDVELPDKCQCIGLDGKLYILGGIWEVPRNSSVSWFFSAKVYMLDLGGLRKWKECANMQAPRRPCGCGVLDGKIYLFGTSGSDACISEVYNPSTDTWSPIESPEDVVRGVPAQVSPVGEELFVIGSYGSWAYHPAKLEWRRLRGSSFQWYAPGTLFIRQGKFHAMTHSEINIYDFETNSWTRLYSFSLAGFAPAGIDPGQLRIEAVRADYDVLLAMVSHIYRPLWQTRTCLIQREKFNSEDKEIFWQKTQWPLPGKEYFHSSSVMCAIQL